MAVEQQFIFRLGMGAMENGYATIGVRNVAAVKGMMLARPVDNGGKVAPRMGPVEEAFRDPDRFTHGGSVSLCCVAARRCLTPGSVASAMTAAQGCRWRGSGEKALPTPEDVLECAGAGFSSPPVPRNDFSLSACDWRT